MQLQIFLLSQKSPLRIGILLFDHALHFFAFYPGLVRPSVKPRSQTFGRCFVPRSRTWIPQHHCICSIFQHEQCFLRGIAQGGSGSFQNKQPWGEESFFVIYRSELQNLLRSWVFLTIWYSKSTTWYIFLCRFFVTKCSQPPVLQGNISTLDPSREQISFSLSSSLRHTWSSLHFWRTHLLSCITILNSP